MNHFTYYITLSVSLSLFLSLHIKYQEKTILIVLKLFKLSPFNQDLPLHEIHVDVNDKFQLWQHPWSNKSTNGKGKVFKTSHDGN